MKTSNFATLSHKKFKGAVSISRFPPKYLALSVPEFTPLFPSRTLLASYVKHKDWNRYSQSYLDQLHCLDPLRVWDRLYFMANYLGADEPVLLCFESSKTLETQPCHRRLVAEWFEKSLDVEVPEV